MPTFIVKLEDYYFEYSTICDAPVCWGMPLEKFKRYYKKKYGTSGMYNYEERMKRVEQFGTSEYGEKSVNGTLNSNRAGPDEKKLTLKEIYTAYCLREPIRDGWIPK